MFESSYDHTQKAPWFLLLFTFAALFFTVAWVTRAEPVVPAISVVAGLLMAMLGYSFQHLTVCDEGDRLAICLGPLPLFRRRIPYDDMTGVEIGGARRSWSQEVSFTNDAVVADPSAEVKSRPDRFTTFSEMCRYTLVQSRAGEAAWTCGLT